MLARLQASCYGIQLFFFFNQSVCFCDDSAQNKKSVTQARAVIKRAAIVGLKIYRGW